MCSVCARFRFCRSGCTDDLIEAVSKIALMDTDLVSIRFSTSSASNALTVDVVFLISPEAHPATASVQPTSADKSAATNGRRSPVHAAHVEEARQKLLPLGLEDAQVADVAAGRKASTHIAIPAPLDGVVTARNVNLGQVVSVAQDLLTVTDLLTYPPSGSKRTFWRTILSRFV